MITAWQISSTMDKMEEFIRFIEQFDTQREKLERLLPVIQRIKRVGDEKESVNRELLELEQTYFILEGNKNSLIENINTTIKMNNKLRNISQEISKQQDDNNKEINKLRREVESKENKEEKELIERREELLKELDVDSVIKFSSKLKEIGGGLKEIGGGIGVDGGGIDVDGGEEEKQEEEGLLLPSLPLLAENPHNIPTTIYNRYIDEEVKSSIDSKIILNENNTAKITEPYTRQLYELKCKLSSLSDKRRKLTVNRLFNNSNNNNSTSNNNNKNNIYRDYNTNIMNKYQYHEKVLESNSKREVAEEEEYKHREKSEENYNNKGLFGSIMAMFSSTNESNNNTSHKSDINTKNNHAKEKEKTKEKLFIEKQNTNPTKQIPNKETNLIQSHHPLPSLYEIDDIEVRLRVAEIIAEIYEFREDINVMVEENLIMRLKSMVSNLESVNKQINCYQEELIKVGRVVKEQMLGNKRNIKDINNNNNNNNNKIISLLKQNSQLQFFTHFINSNIIHRQAILSSIFTSILPTVSSIRKYITRRFTELKNISEEFEYTNRNKYNMKLKATKCKKEFEILTKEMEEIKYYLDENVLFRIKHVQNLLIKGLRMYVEELRDREELGDSLLIVECKMEEQEQYQQQEQEQEQEEIQQLLQPLLKNSNQHLIATVEQELTINSLLERISEENTENNSNNNSGNKNEQFYYYRMQLFYQRVLNTYECLGSIIVV